MFRNPQCVKCLYDNGSCLDRYLQKCRHKKSKPHNFTDIHNVPDGGADGHSTEKDFLGMK